MNMSTHIFTWVKVSMCQWVCGESATAGFFLQLVRNRYLCLIAMGAATWGWIGAPTFLKKVILPPPTPRAPHTRAGSIKDFLWCLRSRVCFSRSQCTVNMSSLWYYLVSKSIRLTNEVDIRSVGFCKSDFLKFFQVLEYVSLCEFLLRD